MSHLLMDHGHTGLTPGEEALSSEARGKTSLFLQSRQSLRLLLQTWGLLSAFMNSSEKRLALLKGFELGFIISEISHSLFTF